ncbi:MAG: formylmethanofuran dehydrogenase subunit B [Planctomycetota bacterium]|nr:formylmethanofuran dehydrogenase subunit B [Planctomycetota bacterium]
MNKTGTVTLENVACTMCGCVCDDLKLTIADGCVVGVSPGCALAEPWLLGQSSSDRPSCSIGGQSVSQDKAVEHAASLLTKSASPLIYGLSGSSTPGQRSAVHLADTIGACIDTTASTCHAPSIVALQSVGESTCSLGEIRNRSDLVIYWGSNPSKSHPRHMERFVDAPGQHVPGGRSARHVVVVDVKASESSQRADTFIQIEPGSDFEVLWALRGLVRGLPLDASAVGGVPRKTLVDLAERMKQCRYGAAFFGLGLTRRGIPHVNVGALLQLVTDLNRHTRFVVRRMRIPGDVAGADSVLCWQTGYPFSVNMNRTYPRYNPGEFTANDLLERHEVDAAVLVGTEGIEKLSDAARAWLGEIPSVILDHAGVDSPVPGTVHFTTAVYGIHRPGTAYRMDETPIPLRKVLDSELPADHEVLNSIISRICRMRETAVRT